MKQTDLFSRPAGRAARDTAIDAVRGAAPDSWLAEAKRCVLRLARTLDSFTTDDVWMELAGFRPPEPRALGAVMRDLARAGKVTATEKYRQSARKACHARPLRVWVRAEVRA